jgi:hypothetical protein
VVKNSSAVVVVFGIHEEKRIETPDFLQAAPGHQPRGSIHRGDPIESSEFTVVSIGDEFRRSRRQIVPKEVSVQEGAGIIEVDRTCHTHLVTLPHEGKELGDRRRLDLRILVQKEDEVGASAQSVVDSNVVGPAESKVASILYEVHTIY